MPIFIWPLLALVGASAIYVRKAPTDASQWHQPIEDRAPGDYKTQGSFTHVRMGASHDDLVRLDRIIRDTPRTKVLAGSIDSNLITYETRSKTMGFPDYSTVQLDGDTGKLSIFGRLRFGKGDMGVNEKRIKGWLGQLDEGQVAQ